MTGLLHIVGGMADQHPVAVFRAGMALGLFGLSFIIAAPIWTWISRRRSSARFHAKFVRPAELRVEPKGRDA